MKEPTSKLADAKITRERLAELLNEDLSRDYQAIIARANSWRTLNAVGERMGCGDTGSRCVRRRQAALDPFDLIKHNNAGDLATEIKKPRIGTDAAGARSMTKTTFFAELFRGCGGVRSPAA